MIGWFKNNSATMWLWAALIGGALIIFALSRGTSFQQLGIGLLASAIALLVAMAVFEAIWLIAGRLFDFSGDQETPGNRPKSRPRGR